MMKALILLSLIFISTSSFAQVKKGSSSYENKKEHKFRGSTLYGEGFESSRSVIKELKPDKFDYIFSQNSNYLDRVNELSRFTGRD